jgi:hypothetical protein
LSPPGPLWVFHARDSSPHRALIFARVAPVFGALRSTLKTLLAVVFMRAIAVLVPPPYPPLASYSAPNCTTLGRFSFLFPPTSFLHSIPRDAPCAQSQTAPFRPSFFENQQGSLFLRKGEQFLCPTTSPCAPFRPQKTLKPFACTARVCRNFFPVVVHPFNSPEALACYNLFRLSNSAPLCFAADITRVGGAGSLIPKASASSLREY